MARCGCASDRCSCTVIGGNGTSVSGTGTTANPYVVEITPDSTAAPDTSGRFSGEITAYGGASPPTGWLLCNGAAISRSTYSTLFSVLGTSYGVGDGSTTFNVPPMNGRVPLMASSTHVRGASGGAETAAIANANLPSHTHTAGIQSASHNHALGIEAVATSQAGGTYIRVTDVNGQTGGSGTNYTAQTQNQSTDHTHAIGATPVATASLPIMPPYTVVQYIIKY